VARRPRRTGRTAHPRLFSVYEDFRPGGIKGILP